MRLSETAPIIHSMNDIRASPDCQLLSPPEVEWLYLVAGLNRSGQGSFDFAGRPTFGLHPCIIVELDLRLSSTSATRNDGGGTRY